MRPPTPAAIVIVGLAVALTSCSDCGDETPPMPESADARLEMYAETLPAQTESALFVADIPALTEGASSLKRRIGGFVPGTSFAARQVKSLVGVDLFAEQGWSDVGIDEGGGAAFALYAGHPVVLAHVTDRRAFERRLERLAKRHYDITGPVRLQSGDDLQMKTVHRSGAQIAWTYQRRLAIVVFPTLPWAPDTSLTVTNALRDLAVDGGVSSLAETEAYQSLRSHAAQGPNLAYLRPRSVTSYLAADGGFRAVALGTAVNWVLDPVTGLSAAIAKATDRIRGSVWLGTRSELANTIDEVASVDPEAFGSDLTGSETLLAARIALDPTSVWRRGLDALPEASSRTLRRRVKRWRDRTGVDPVEDLLAPATGRIALAIQGVERDFSLPTLVSDPLGQLATVDAVVAVEFDSEKAASAVQQKLREVTAEETFFGLPLKLVHDGKRLLLVTEASVVEVTGEAPSDLGTTFVDDGAAASLYLNGPALAAQFKNRLPPGSMPARLLERFGGALVSLSHRTGGLVLEGRADLN